MGFPMKCRQCGAEGVIKTVTVHHYDECGLEGVKLLNVPLKECPACGHREIGIPAIERLHRAIAMAILERPGRFTGPEVRFLRKYLGYDQASFADQLSVHPTVISQWETGQKVIGATTAKLIRMMVLEEKQVTSYPRRERFAERLEEELPPFAVSLVAMEDGWKLAS